MANEVDVNLYIVLLYVLYNWKLKAMEISFFLW